MLGCSEPRGSPGLGDRGISGRPGGSRRVPSRRGDPDYLHRPPVKDFASRPSPMEDQPLMQDQRGAVLPLAMLSLLVLSAVLLGLSLLSGQEPLVARNHILMAQAQAMAEAGLDRALWALSTPEAPDGIQWTAAAPAPYDGSRLMAVAVDGVPLGGFRVTVSGAGDRQRQILATGLVPGDSGPLGRARQDISATAIRLPISITPGRDHRSRRPSDRQRSGHRRE